MFDREILKDVIADYKRDFTKFQWKEEHYKWEAVKCFQDMVKVLPRLRMLAIVSLPFERQFTEDLPCAVLYYLNAII